MISHPLWSCILAPAVFWVAEDTLRFAPSEDLELRTQFESESTLELVRSSHCHTINGVRGEAIDPEVDSSEVERTTVVFRERFERWDDGGEARVDRHFEDLSKTTTSVIQARGQGLREREYEAESELEGKRVLLTRSEGEDGFRAHLHEEDGEEGEAVEGLDVASPLVFLLRGTTEELPELGSRWDLPGGCLGRVLNPAGDTGLEFDADGFPVELLEKTRPVWSEEEGTAKLVAIEGRRAHIEVTLEGTSEFRSEFSHGALQALDTGTLSNVERNHYDLEGRLVWDLDGNRPLTLELSGDHFRESVGLQRSQGSDESLEIESIQEYEGTIKLSLESTELVR